MLVLKRHLFALRAVTLGPIISPKNDSDYKSEISFINQVDYYLSNPLIFISQLFLWENGYYVKYTQTQRRQFVKKKILVTAYFLWRNTFFEWDRLLEQWGVYRL